MYNKFYTIGFHAVSYKSSFLRAKLCFLPALLIFFALSARAQTAPTVLTNAGVIEMHKAGLGSDIILSSIENSVCKFNVTSTGLVTLKKSGVEELVIKAMIERQGGKSVIVTASQATSAKPEKKEALAKKSEGSALTLLNHVYYSPAAAEPKALEKLVAGIRTKQGAFGGSILFQVEGAKSGLRFASEDNAVFAINTGSDVLPELVLYKLKIAKGKREVATMKAGTFSGVKTGEDVITLDISKLGNGVFKITPGKKLLPGEYFFTGKPSTGSSSADAFAFGID
jgi:hypothetical protein